MVNKFLYENGGSETYMLRLGNHLQQTGHDVQYFGMEHERRIVGNRAGAYTKNMDFHAGILSGVSNVFRTIYSSETRKKLRTVLNDFAPDVVHLNNFHYQLTPTVITETVAWKRETHHPCKIIYTAHDYQMICPNHMLYNPGRQMNCEKCIGGHFINCLRGKCIHGSTAKSAIGMIEAAYWNRRDTYRQIDHIICCSRFMKKQLDRNPVFREKTVAMHNFIDCPPEKKTEKKDYVLYFGRISSEKGIGTLLGACRRLPEVPFVFAGRGPMEDALRGLPNVKALGFQTGEALETIIREARFSIIPSEWYENCPYSVMESQAYETPVLGANIGGIPELIEDGIRGELFESGDTEDLTRHIKDMWEDREKLSRYTENCRTVPFDDTAAYVEKLIPYYE